MGGLNIASYALLVGAMGQHWFYARFLSHVPEWIVLAILFLPWLTTFTISFCNAAPFGPRPFRRCLLAAMSGFALLTVLAEVIQVFVQLPPDGHIPISAARVLMYFGFVSFIPFTRAYIQFRDIEMKGTPNRVPVTD